jgi:hypothetical protein
MARELTLTLDEQTIQQIESAAETFGKSKSQIVQEALAGYRAIPDRLTEAERQRMLKALDEMMRTPSPKTAEEVQQEIEDIRAARRSGGRRTPVE